MFSSAASDQDLQRQRCRRLGRRGMERCAGNGIAAGDGQVDDEFTALRPSAAEDLDMAAVHLDQAPDQRKADAEATACAIRHGAHLREQLEDRRLRVGRYADAVVLHPEADRFAPLFDPKPHVAAVFGVLVCIADQVAEDLGQPHRIRPEPDRLARHVQGHVAHELLRERLAGIDGVLNHGLQGNAFDVQLQLALRDAVGVEQIVDQAHQMAQLPRVPVLRLARQLAVGAGLSQDVRGVAQRRERPAQFMRQDIEELVLAPVRFAQRFERVAAETRHLHVRPDPRKEFAR